MSDDSTQDPTVSESELQDVSRPRNWRQRYAGPEGEYVFRTSMSIRTPGGQSRRVERGEVVDAAAMSITPRRLKALWYSNNIELADQNAPRAGGRKLKKVLVDNLELQREEETRQFAALNASRKENELRKQIRAQAREEAQLRALSEKAVKVAEERELAEMRELGLEDDRAAFEALIQERVHAAEAKAEEDAELQKQLAEEKAVLDEIRNQELADRESEAAAKKAVADADRREKKEARARARVANIMGTRRFNEEQAPVPHRNPETETISADEAIERAQAANRGS